MSDVQLRPPRGAHFHNGTWQRKYVQVYMYCHADLTNPRYANLFADIRNMLQGHTRASMAPAWGTYSTYGRLYDAPRDRTLIVFTADTEEDIEAYIDACDEYTINGPHHHPEIDELGCNEVLAWRNRTATYCGRFYCRNGDHPADNSWLILILNTFCGLQQDSAFCLQDTDMPLIHRSQLCKPSL